MESGNKVDRTLLEEDENPPSAGGDRVPSLSREEVWLIQIYVIGPLASAMFF